MNWAIEVTNEFISETKRLAKKYHGFKKDFQQFVDTISDDPYQGVELSPGIRKIRLAISAKGKGKSGGARVITFTYCVSEEEGIVYLLLIYDKQQSSTVDTRIVRQLIGDLGFDIKSMCIEGKLKIRE
ncbi:MAG: addiction module toxin RelE [Phocaeicola sp.]|uniref:addiction module toxin RelE n=1 Tax=Phocaeicola sp. TaxID=2773926 RepID=UPI003F9FF4A7